MSSSVDESVSENMDSEGNGGARQGNAWLHQSQIQWDFLSPASIFSSSW
jgi:hypothetical protein